MDHTRVVEIAARLRAGVDIKDRRHRLKKYPATFLGVDAVTFLESGYTTSTAEAIKLGNIMIREGIFHHVCDDHLLENTKLFYRFYTDEEKPKHVVSAADLSCSAHATSVTLDVDIEQEDITPIYNPPILDVDIEQEDITPIYNPPILFNLPRLQLQIKGKFTKQGDDENQQIVRHLGRLNKDNNTCISYSHAFSTQKRTPIKFIFVNILTGASDYGICNVLAVDGSTGDYLGVLYNDTKEGDATCYLKFDPTQTIGVSRHTPLPSPYQISVIKVKSLSNGDAETQLSTKMLETEETKDTRETQENNPLCNRIRGDSHLALGIPSGLFYDLAKAKCPVSNNPAFWSRINMMIPDMKQQTTTTATTNTTSLSYLKCIDEQRSTMLELQIEKMIIDKKRLVKAINMERQNTVKGEIKIDRLERKVAEILQCQCTLQEECETLRAHGKKKQRSMSVLKKEVLRQRDEGEMRDVELEICKNEIRVLNAKLTNAEKKLFACLEDLNVANKRVMGSVDEMPSSHKVPHYGAVNGGEKSNMNEDVANDSCQTCSVQ